jgi:hypothetical protein
VLGIVLISYLMIGLDISIVITALPQLKRASPCRCVSSAPARVALSPR